MAEVDGMRSAYLRRVGHFAVSAIGRDRPGIVAAITAGLLEVNGNVEDSRMTNLGGHFAVMLLVATPEADREAVEAALAGARSNLDLEALTVSEVDVSSASTSPSHVITVYGADHPGIVHAVTSGLAELGVNITDLQTQLGGPPASPLYVMTLEVELGEESPEKVAERLEEIAAETSVEVRIHPLGAEEL
jgi:glycine cleavage system transcriptional repressor